MTRQERIRKVLKEKDTIIAQKKSQMKKADAIEVVDATIKATKEADVDDDKTELKALLIINTTNFMDSHGDVHIPGLWRKSLSENRNIMHLQEHKMEFDKIIADGTDLNAYTESYLWKDLGYPYHGTTEALVFGSVIKRERNTYMFDQYRKGRVNNHSVGMGYVKIELAADDKSEDEYYNNWDKYIDQIANKEVAEDAGYFWVVKEAKVIEGSAVPVGSNTATPTYDIKGDTEPLAGTLKALKQIVEPQETALTRFYNNLKL